MLRKELCLRDVVGAKVDALHMANAAFGEVHAEEPALATNVQHTRLGGIGSEQSGNGFADEITPVEIAPGIRVRDERVGNRVDSVGERIRDSPWPQALNGRAEIGERHVEVAPPTLRERRPLSLDLLSDPRQQVLDAELKPLCRRVSRPRKESVLRAAGGGGVGQRRNHRVFDLEALCDALFVQRVLR